MTAVSRRHDLVILFDVTNGNPNGDPDAGNLPRLDPDTGHGLVTDVSLKRKLRNYVETARPDAPGFNIYVRDGALLNEQHRKAYLALRPGDAETASAARLDPRNAQEAAALRRFMCANFFDVRAFGAVMSTGINAGQVRGPVQMTFAHSVEPVVPQEIAITRVAATGEGGRAGRGAEVAGAPSGRQNRTMGRKFIVPYALYRAHLFVSAPLAQQTGFSEADLELLREALGGMFEHDRSAARGEMAMRRIVVFRHAKPLGCAPAHTLFERVRIARRVADRPAGPGPDKESAAERPPARRFSDYEVTVDRSGLPDGVEIGEWV